MFGFDDDHGYRPQRISVDAALICENGHVINGRFHNFPQANTEFYAECGAQNIHACKKCNTEIRGQYSNLFGGFDAPKYCHKCGFLYPWTESRLAAAKELTDQAEKLSLEEKEQLKSTFDDLIKETPRTPVAISKYKKLTQKAGSFITEGIQKILVDVMASYVKKELHIP